MKKCPFCAEEIQDEAAQCRHCGRIQPPSPPARPDEILAPGELRFTHAGTRYLLGALNGSFAIWDRESPGPPVDKFPSTDDGWRSAWLRAHVLEPGGLALATPSNTGATATKPGAANRAAVANKIDQLRSLAREKMASAVAQPAVAEPAVAQPAVAEPAVDSTPESSDPEAEEVGHGKFGDGVTAALYEFQASRFKGGRLFTPNVIRVWPDRIEEYAFHAVRKKGTQGIGYQHVSEVTLARGLVWSDISVESTGGRSIVMHGMPKADAERVKKILDDAVAAMHDRSHGAPSPSAPAPAVDVADQLKKLAELRKEGILTEEEFAAQKAKLLA